LRRIKHGTKDLREFKTKQFNMFEKPQQEPLHKEKKCSDCDSYQAWFSIDSGKTWQCKGHKKW
jgi:hypothetical protein